MAFKKLEKERIVRFDLLKGEKLKCTKCPAEVLGLGSPAKVWLVQAYEDSVVDTLCPQCFDKKYTFHHGEIVLRSELETLNNSAGI